MALPESPWARVEEFLLSLDGVLDVSVWASNGSPVARVTVEANSTLSEPDILQACLTELGPKASPRLLMLRRALRPAA